MSTARGRRPWFWHRPERSYQPERKAAVSGSSSYSSMPFSTAGLGIAPMRRRMSFEASELVSTRTRTARSCSALTVAWARAGSTKYGVSASTSDFRLIDRPSMSSALRKDHAAVARSLPRNVHRSPCTTSTRPHIDVVGSRRLLHWAESHGRKAHSALRPRRGRSQWRTGRESA